MKTLKTHIVEGLLQGMDSTLDYGDKVIKGAEREFKGVRLYFANVSEIEKWKYWKTTMGSEIYQISFNVPNICSMLGFDDKKYITIHCVSAPYTRQKDFTVGFYFHEKESVVAQGEYYPIDLDNTMNMIEILKSLKSKFKTFNDFIHYTKSIL